MRWSCCIDDVAVLPSQRDGGGLSQERSAKNWSIKKFLILEAFSKGAQDLATLGLVVVAREDKAEVNLINQRDDFRADSSGCGTADGFTY